MNESMQKKGISRGFAQGWSSVVWGLSVALCFSISPIFIRHGLEILPSPLLGVTIGMVFSALGYGILLLLRRNHVVRSAISRSTMIYQLAAGVLVGLSTWARWFALDHAAVGVVLALGRLNVPVVILVSPFLLGQQLERVTPKVVLGALLIVTGSVLLAFTG